MTTHTAKPPTGFETASAPELWATHEGHLWAALTRGTVAVSSLSDAAAERLCRWNDRNGDWDGISGDDARAIIASWLAEEL